MMQLGKPPSGAAAEKLSFVNQVPKCFNTLKAPGAGLRERILDITENLYTNARWLARRVPHENAELLSVGQDILATLNKDASPGFPWIWMGVTINADILKSEQLAAQVCQAFALLMQKIVLSEELPLPMVRLFIKMEAHKHAKLRDGRYRLIWAYPVEYQMVHRFFLQSSITAEIENCESIPSKPGTSFVYGGTRRLYSWINDDSKTMLEADKSSWDMTVPESLQLMERDARWRLCLNPDQVGLEDFKFGFDQCYRTLTQSNVIFSDGTILEQLVPGIVRSGGFITISGNSRMQVLLKVWFCIDSTNVYCDASHRLMAMGDDTIERMNGLDAKEYVDWMNRKGFSMKHANVGSLVGLSFCSHVFRRVEGNIVCVPTNWPKHQFNLSIKQSSKVPFYDMQLYSLLFEYAFDDDVFHEIRGELLRVAPKLAVSQKRAQNFLTGYEADLPVLSGEQRMAVLKNDTFLNLRNLYGFRFQGPVRCAVEKQSRSKPLLNFLLLLFMALFLLPYLRNLYGPLQGPDRSVVPEQSMFEYRPDPRSKPPGFFQVLRPFAPLIDGKSTFSKTIGFLGHTPGMPKRTKISGSLRLSDNPGKKLKAKKAAALTRSAQQVKQITQKIKHNLHSSSMLAGMGLAATAPNLRKPKGRLASVRASQFGMDYARFQGRDLVTKLLLSAALTSSFGKDIAGTLLYSASIRPQQLIPNSRLARLIGLFQKFRLRKFRFVFESGLPAGSNAGSMLFVHEPDPNEALPAQFAAPSAGTLSNYDSHSATSVVPMAQIPLGLSQAPGRSVRTDLNLGLFGGWFLVDPQNKATAVENTAGQFAIFVQDVHSILGSSGSLPTSQYEIGSLFLEYDIEVSVASDSADMAGGYTSMLANTSTTGVPYQAPGNEASQTFSPTGFAPIGVAATSLTNWFGSSAANYGLKLGVQYDGTNEWFQFPGPGVYFVEIQVLNFVAADFGSTHSGFGGWVHHSTTGSTGSVLHSHTAAANSSSSLIGSGPVAVAVIDVEDPLLDFFSPGNWILGTGGSATNTSTTSAEMRAILLPPEATQFLRRKDREEKKEKELFDRVIAALSKHESKEEKKEMKGTFPGALPEGEVFRISEASERWMLRQSEARVRPAAAPTRALSLKG